MHKTTLWKHFWPTKAPVRASTQLNRYPCWLQKALINLILFIKAFYINTVESSYHTTQTPVHTVEKHWSQCFTAYRLIFMFLPIFMKLSHNCTCIRIIEYEALERCHWTQDQCKTTRDSFRGSGISWSLLKKNREISWRYQIWETVHKLWHFLQTWLSWASSLPHQQISNSENNRHHKFYT